MQTVFLGCMQIGRAMEYLHDQNVVHRDLKSENVFVNHNDVYKVGNLGLARKTAPDMSADTGSYRWMAPEVIRHEKYGLPCDVYSFAILLCEMMTITKPFSNMTQIEVAFGVARDGKRPHLPLGIPDDVNNLVTRCWAEKPDERPTFEDVNRKIEHILSKKMSFGVLEMSKIAFKTSVAQP